MKRLILTAAVILASAATVFAQKYIVVDSEKIFKSIAEYNEAIKTLDEMSEKYQEAVDAKFNEIESLYSTYVSQKASLSTATRNAYEQQILSQEKAATEYQQSIFGNDGVIMKKRIELIQPIQSRVFSAIEKYAKENGCDMVVDIASNPSVLFYSDALNHTDAIVNLLKK